MEATVFRSFRGWYRSHSSLTAPLFDYGLREAAWRLADRLAHRQIRSLPHRWVIPALWLSGRSDHQIRIFAMAFRTPQELTRSLQRALASRLAGQRPNFFGLAVVSHRVNVCLMILARRGVILRPIARLWRVGDIARVEGRLLPGFKHPKLVLGTPHGKVIRPKVQLDAKGYFSASWRVRWGGKTQVQIMVEDDKGPWISAQWDLWSWAHKQKQRTVWRRLWVYYLKQLSYNTTTPSRTRQRWNSRTAAHRLWQIVNQQRQLRKLPQLRRHPTLDALAQAHANDMVREQFFAHTSPQQGSFTERFQTLGWRVRAAHENIVVAFSPKEAYQYWYQSPSHRSNLIAKRLKLTGVGAAIDSTGAIFFVQVYVRK